jgi:predicted RNA-binding protein with PIN domain
MWNDVYGPEPDPRKNAVSHTVREVCFDFDPGGYAEDKTFERYADRLRQAAHTELVARKDLTEQIRRVLAKGAYYMTPDELPYESQARAVVHLLEGIHE